MNIFSLLEQAYEIQSQLKQLNEAKRLMEILIVNTKANYYQNNMTYPPTMDSTITINDTKTFNKLREVLGEL